MSDDRKILKFALICDFNLPDDFDEFGPIRPTLRGRPKTEWGFLHDLLRKLLCPHDMDPCTIGYVATFFSLTPILPFHYSVALQMRPGAFDVPEIKFPCFLWLGRAPPRAPGCLMDGFLLGDIPIKVSCHKRNLDNITEKLFCTIGLWSCLVFQGYRNI
jgi:hypothetical protein